MKIKVSFTVEFTPYVEKLMRLYYEKEIKPDSDLTFGQWLKEEFTQDSEMHCLYAHEEMRKTLILCHGVTAEQLEKLEVK